MELNPNHHQTSWAVFFLSESINNPLLELSNACMVKQYDAEFPLWPQFWEAMYIVERRFVHVKEEVKNKHPCPCTCKSIIGKYSSSTPPSSPAQQLQLCLRRMDDLVVCGHLAMIDVLIDGEQYHFKPFFPFLYLYFSTNFVADR